MNDLINKDIFGGFVLSYARKIADVKRRSPESVGQIYAAAKQEWNDARALQNLKGAIMLQERELYKNCVAEDVKYEERAFNQLGMMRGLIALRRQNILQEMKWEDVEGAIIRVVNSLQPKL